MLVCWRVFDIMKFTFCRPLVRVQIILMCPLQHKTLVFSGVDQWKPKDSCKS